MTDAETIAKGLTKAIEQTSAEIMEWANSPLNDGPWQEEAYRHAIWTQTYMQRLSLNLARILREQRND